MFAVLPALGGAERAQAEVPGACLRVGDPQLGDVRRRVNREEEPGQRFWSRRRELMRERRPASSGTSASPLSSSGRLPDSHLSVAFPGMNRGTPWFRQPNTVTLAPLRADCGRKHRQMSPSSLPANHLPPPCRRSRWLWEPLLSGPERVHVKNPTMIKHARFAPACLEHLDEDVSSLCPQASMIYLQAHTFGKKYIYRFIQASGDASAYTNRSAQE